MNELIMISWVIIIIVNINILNVISSYYMSSNEASVKSFIDYRTLDELETTSRKVSDFVVCDNDINHDAICIISIDTKYACNIRK